MKNNYSCEVDCLNEDVVYKVKSKMLSDSILFKVADNFQILGDSTRLKLLHAISHQELCVCDIANVLSMSQSATSHQLRVLKAANLVKFRKQGKIIYYSLSDKHMLELITTGVKHARE